MMADPHVSQKHWGLFGKKKHVEVTRLTCLTRQVNEDRRTFERSRPDLLAFKGRQVTQVS